MGLFLLHAPWQKVWKGHHKSVLFCPVFENQSHWDLVDAPFQERTDIWQRKEAAMEAVCSGMGMG